MRCGAKEIRQYQYTIAVINFFQQLIRFSDNALGFFVLLTLLTLQWEQ